jgi:hypothetical protein
LFSFKSSIGFLGLAGKLHSNLDDVLGGEYSLLDENDLLAIDREGRAIMTEHELE